MDELLEWMDYIEDKRQQTKVRKISVSRRKYGIS